MKEGAEAIGLGSGDLYIKSNHQDFQRFADVDVAITGDGEATMTRTVSLQCDGDLRMTIGVLWTAAHHKSSA